MVNALKNPIGNNTLKSVLMGSKRFFDLRRTSGIKASITNMLIENAVKNLFLTH